MPETKKTCFIIMPISTPEAFIERYRDRGEHFRHVLDCLFVPSVEKAGYSAIPPLGKGSDLIHAEIIKNLEEADLVLCDMSCLNPNVFFELGIRTSLNKPVCVIRDEFTKKVPFDTAILNHLEYDSSLEPWKLDNEVEKVAEHIRESHERSKGKNTLWRHFGIKAEAKPFEGATGTEAKLDMLTYQIESLRQKLESSERSPSAPWRSVPRKPDIAEIYEDIKGQLPTAVIARGYLETPSGLEFVYAGELTDEWKLHMAAKVDGYYGATTLFRSLGE